MAYAPVIDKDLDKYRSDSEIDAQWLRLDGTNGPQNSIQWDLTPAQTPAEGLMYWNEDEGGLNIGMPGGNVNLQIGQETLTRVKATEAILNGQVVYVDGADGSNPTISLAKGDAEATSHGTIGVATEDIGLGQSGYITTYGRVRELNTVAFTAGDDLYLSPTTAGALTNVRPDGDFVVHIGNCIRSHATQGEILVRVDVVHEATEIRMKTVGASTTFTTVQEMQDIFHSSGVGFGGVISDNGDGTYAVATGGGYIRATNDPTSVLYSFDWPANNSLTPSDGRNYVGVEYNAGSPQVVQRSSYDWNYQTDFPLGEVVKEGSVLHIFNAQHKVGDHAGKMIEAMEETMAFARDQRTGGLILGETGTRNVTLTAGNVWYGLTEFPITAKNTSTGDTFDTYYRDGVGGWTLGTGVTQWQNSQYDDGSGTLQSLTVNRYAVNWFYIDVENNGELVMVYPQAQYATLAAAEGDDLPADLPDRLISHGRLIGRIIFQQGASTASSVETVFTTMFSSSQIVNHNNLAGLQGGTTGEYYHLTSTQASYINQDVTTTASPNFDGLEIDGAVVFNNTITNPIRINRNSSTSESLSIQVNDNHAEFRLSQDADENSAHYFIFDADSSSTGEIGTRFEANGSLLFKITDGGVVSYVDLSLNNNNISSVNSLTASTINVSASNNHIITSTADDLLVQNFNTNDSIIFETTDTSGNTDKIMELGGTNQTVMITNERSQAMGNGIIQVAGSWTAANGAALRFQPTITSGNFFGILVDPTMQSTGIFSIFSGKPIYSATNSTLRFLEFVPTLSTTNNHSVTRYNESLPATFFNSAVSVLYDGFNVGASRSAFDFGGGSPIITENMIKLTGGANASGGTASITQKGLVFTGFNSVAGNSTVKALEANGGLFDFQFDNGTFGAVRFGAGNDASIGYDGTDMTINTALTGSGVLKLSASTNWTANGTGTVTISNVAPAGVGTATISKWLTVKDNSGNTMYIPAWM